MSNNTKAISEEEKTMIDIAIKENLHFVNLRDGSILNMNFLIEVVPDYLYKLSTKYLLETNPYKKEELLIKLNLQRDQSRVSECLKDAKRDLRENQIQLESGKEKLMLER